MAIVTATITYTGTLLAGVLQVQEWDAVGVQFPDHGSAPWRPQFNLDVLQPSNVDGARYRTGGAHFPSFRMLAVIPAPTFPDADTIARDLELLKGDTIRLSSVITGRALPCVVVESRARATAKRTLGAAANVPNGLPGNPAGGADALASVELEFTLQAVSL